MSIKRRIHLVLYSIFTLITFRKFYICEECHHIHKFTGNEWDDFANLVFINVDCGNAVIDKVRNVLISGLLKN